MLNFVDLEPYGDNRQLRMIVETPRGSNIKLEYEPQLRAFSVSRALPLGRVYPYDWGFIPGTKGEDGDPIDALAGSFVGPLAYRLYADSSSALPR